MASEANNGINLMAITKEHGVADLPLHVRGPFARALAAERNGGSYTVEGMNGKPPTTRTAAEWLDAAILAEANGHAS